MKHKSKVKNTTSRMEYKVYSNEQFYELYYDEGWFVKNGLYSYQRRMYRSWKNNRRHQWKVK